MMRLMGARGGQRTEPRGTGIDQAIAYPAMFLLLFEVPGFSLVPISAFLAIAMLPVLVRHAWYRSTRSLLLAAVAAVACGLLLRVIPVIPADRLAPDITALSIAFWIAGFPLIVALGLWGAEKLGTRQAAVLGVLGALVSAFLQVGGDLQWKGTLGIYLVLLALLLIGRRVIAAALVLIAAAAISVAEDARSMAVVAIITLVILIILRPSAASRAGTVRLVVVAVAVVVFFVWAMTEGWLGDELQRRTLNQLRNPLLIVGGARVEWAATVALALPHPFGYGIGVIPSSREVAAGIGAVRDAGGDWTSPYFSEVVFGARVDLHSTIADLWYHAGLGGVALGMVILVLLVRGLAPAVAARPVVGYAGVFAILMGVWDTLFSPMANNDRIIIAVVLALAVRYLPTGGHDRPLDVSAELRGRSSIRSRPSSRR